MNRLAEDLKARDIVEILTEHGIRTSHQRVVILRYLIEHDTHPSVDTMYRDLAPSIPGLSKTTVYNTVKLLSDKGLIDELGFDSKEQRYDLHDGTHGHFRCRSCGKIFDIPIRKSEALKGSVPKGFKVEEERFYLTGLCAECA